MSNRSQRSFRSKHAHTIAKAFGIIIALIGICFIAIVRGETDARNAKCTEKTVGIVSDVRASGSKYLNTIEYVGDDVECSVTAEIKKGKRQVFNGIPDRSVPGGLEKAEKEACAEVKRP